MISMNCPSCGAEGRIPRDRVNVRMLCKRCLKSFHLTPDGKVVGGPPPMDPTAPHEHAGPDLDAVEREMDVMLAKLRAAAPKLVGVGVLAVAVLVAWLAMRGGEVPSLDDQTIHIARALARNDVAELRSLSVDGTGDQAAELSEALAPEFRDPADIHRSASPSVEVVRGPESPGPGLAEVVATIRADQPVGRMGTAVPDVSVSMKPTTVDVPMVLAGDDRAGWRLDGKRTLEAYRASRAPATPVRVGRPAPSSTKPTPGDDAEEAEDADRM